WGFRSAPPAQLRMSARTRRSLARRWSSSRSRCHHLPSQRKGLSPAQRPFRVTYPIATQPVRTIRVVSKITLRYKHYIALREAPVSEHQVRMIILSTDDLDESIRFYGETLGMSLKFRDGAHFAALDGGPVTIALATAADHPMHGQVVIGVK